MLLFCKLFIHDYQSSKKKVDAIRLLIGSLPRSRARVMRTTVLASQEPKAKVFVKLTDLYLKVQWSPEDAFQTFQIYLVEFWDLQGHTQKIRVSSSKLLKAELEHQSKY